MITRASLQASLYLLLTSTLFAQNLSFPSSPGGAATNMADSALNLVQSTMMDGNLFTINTQNRSPLESPTGSLSKLDLKAPGKAKREYDKGYQLLMRKDMPGAVDHLTIATTIYPSYVSAHNALGSAYLGLGQNDQARNEFTQAVSLDDHLPSSYLNLGCAELALKHYPAAEEAMQKASNIAPLDLTLLTALAYGQLMNKDYAGTIATAQKVHEHKHQGAAMAHLYAAAAWEKQNKFPEANQELLTLLREDPKSPAAAQAVQMIDELKQDQKRLAAGPATDLKVSYTTVASQPTGPVALPERIRQLLQEQKEKAQIAEAEAAADCPNCNNTGSPASPESAAASAPGTAAQPAPSTSKYKGLTLHASVDEVAIFFAATDHGKSVTDLTGKDIGIRDDRKPPAAVTGFRNEGQLPLRLGLVIDTSASIEGRFKFEQEAAANFIKKVVTGPTDLAFVVGFANSVLLVQDFTGDQQLIARGVGQLVPSGGTALWDAVDYAAEKLSKRPEAEPVARILVVISDGQDNSSSVTLKEAINRAQHGEVAVYTVSSREAVADPLITTESGDGVVGEHALAILSNLTGGAAFAPGNVHRLDSSFADLQQVIRSRYLITYRPALFKRDGQYRAIDIKVEKDGHKLRVYARKGYYASSANSPAADHY
jgi:Ca-activated chloride channel family protein